MTAETNTVRAGVLPAAVRRASATALTVGLVGSGLVLGSGAAYADDDFEPQDSTNDVPLEYPENQPGEGDTTGGYGPDAELTDSEGDPTEAGEFYYSNAENFWAPEPQSGLLGTQSPGNQPIGEAEETGLFAGQSLRYEVQVDLQRYADLYAGYAEAEEAEGAEDASDIEFEIRNQIPAGISVDLDSVEFHSSSGEHGKGSLLTGNDFSADIRGDNDDLLRILLDEDWLAENVLSGNEYTTLYLTFDAAVDDDAQQYAQLHAQAYQQIVVPQPARYNEVEGEDGETDYEQTNEGERDTYRFYDDPVSVQVLGADPEQRVLDTSGDPVGDRVAVGGDLLDFEVTLDGTLAGEITEYDEDLGETEVIQDHTDPAYDIEDFGLVETFNASVLQVDADSVSVAGEPGEYSVEVDNSSGELRIFVDDPEAWLGEDYTVTYQAEVQDVEESTSTSIETVQVIDEAEFAVEEADSVSVASIAPSKAAVQIDEDGEITEVEEVEHETQFHYRVTSSETPENALYPVSEWSVVDELSRGDQALHDDFEVRAETDIVDSEGETVFAAGDVIDGSYFSLTASGDSYAVEASDAFVQLAGDQQAQWSVYVKATRIANAGVETSNTGNELRNGFQRGASVTTATVGAEDPEEETEEETELALSAPEQAEQGETIEVSGSGFTAGGEVEVSVNPEETFTADENGEFSGELTIPEDAETGEREITALDVETEDSVSSEIEIVAASSEEEEEEEGSGTEESGTEGSGTEGSGTEGSGTEGSGTEGSGTEGSGTEEEEEEESGEEETSGTESVETAGTTGGGSSEPGSGGGAEQRTWSGEEQTPTGGGEAQQFQASPSGGEAQPSAQERLAQTGVSAPWLIGGSALLLMAAGAGALAMNRVRTTGSLFGNA